jgi:hypothetical protein
MAWNAAKVQGEAIAASMQSGGARRPARENRTCGVAEESTVRGDATVDFTTVDFTLTPRSISLDRLDCLNAA